MLRIFHPPSASSNPSPHPCIVLYAGNRRCIFNAPEGTIRSFVERGIGVASIRKGVDIFVSNATTAAAGLGGLIHTISDKSSRDTEINIYGPPPLAFHLASMRSFLRRQDQKVNIREFCRPEHSKDFAFPERLPSAKLAEATVWPLLSYPEHISQESTLGAQTLSATALQSRKRRRGSNGIDDSASNATSSGRQSLEEPQAQSSGYQRLLTEHLRFMFDSRYYAGCEEAASAPAAGGPDRTADKSLRQVPMQPVSQEALPPKQPLSVSYACTMEPWRKMDAEKFVELGVRPGPSRAKLKMGESVTILRPKEWAQLSPQQRQRWSHSREKQKSKADDAGWVASLETEEVLIRASECAPEEEPSPLILVIQVPSPDHLPSFFSEGNQKSLLEAGVGTVRRIVVVHSTPAAVLTDGRYQDWIRSLPAASGASVHHIFTDATLGRDLPLHSAPIENLLRLSQADPKLFMPPHSLIEADRPLRDCMPPSVLDSAASTAILEQDIHVHLQPHFAAPCSDQSPSVRIRDIDHNIHALEGPDFEKTQNLLVRGMARIRAYDSVEQKSIVHTLDPEERQAMYDKFLGIAAQAGVEVGAAEKEGQTIQRDSWKGIQVTTLGTGSAVPQPQRNVSGTLLRVPAQFFKSAHESSATDDSLEASAYILLDAGEGTLGQLRQRFGPTKALDEVLRNLKVFFVSHPHADHCAGVSTLLRARAELDPPPVSPLYLIGNAGTLQYLREYDLIHPMILADSEIKSGTGTVYLLSSEHLDHQTGVADGRYGDCQDDAANERRYLDFMERDQRDKFVKWLSKLRKEVLSRSPFRDMSPQKQASEKASVDKKVWELACERNYNLRKGSGSSAPDFAEEGKQMYFRWKEQSRRETRAYWKKFREDCGPHIALQTAEVDHGIRDCYGLACRFRDPSPSGSAEELFSFAYSGDTRPCQAFEDLAREVHLLIHEGTMMDNMAQEAARKFHSTIGGAIASGIKAGVKLILLTHFSQRHPNLGGIRLAPRSERPAVALALDHLQLDMNDIWKMEYYLPVFKALYEFSADGNDEKDAEDGATD